VSEQNPSIRKWAPASDSRKESPHRIVNADGRVNVGAISWHCMTDENSKQQSLKVASTGAKSRAKRDAEKLS